MTTREAIRALQKRGYSRRRIARELGIHRNTVTGYLGGEDPRVEDGAERPKCTISTPGPQPDPGANSEPGAGTTPDLLGGSGGAAGVPDESECTVPTAAPAPGSGAVSARGRGSHCEPYRELIESMLESQLHARRIWQDLVDDHDFAHSYQSVKRLVAKLKEADPKRVWRMECEPGEEVQVDYGTMWVELAGKRKKVHLLRVTLSHSRRGYTEAMPRQDTESFIRGIENALRHFGGVPRMLVLDNLKAGVLKPCHYDPEINPKFAAFCEHYNIVPLPTLPRTPQHKGKVERGVGYVKESAVRGRGFASLYELNLHLRDWERSIADKRIHGTTRKQVAAHFEAGERASLGPLPAELFPSFVEARRRVHRDGYVEFERAYYEAPPEYISRELWVRSDGRMVRIFDLRMEQVAVHTKLGPGQFSRALGSGGTPRSVAQSLEQWVERASELGDDVGLWARGLVLKRKEAGLRVLMGLVNGLLPRHGSAALNRACGRARLHGQYRLKEVENWLEQPAGQEAFSFLSDHALIRDMGTYGDLVGFEGNN